MLLNNLMEGESMSTKNLITSIKKFNTDEKEHGTIKALLKNFIIPDSENMAIKHKQSFSEKCIYSVPIKPVSPINERTKSINEAKRAFLNATVNPSSLYSKAKKEPILHYAELATTTESDDTRSTGGGKVSKSPEKRNKQTPPVDVLSAVKKRIEQQPRKVSFKIKNASTSYRRPPIVTKTTMTITSNKVSELTKKFNDLIIEGNKTPIKSSKLVKTIENLQTVSRCSASSSSTPSSTLSSSSNIKIVLRHRRSSKRRGYRKRCSSVNSIDKLFLTDNTSGKIRVIRSKSDGTKIPKSPKKRLKYQDSSEQQSGSDTIDGSPSKSSSCESPKNNLGMPIENNVVKNVIKKFECEISAQATCNTMRKSSSQINNISLKEKPKVPEKKSSLVLTKNIVFKDGVPKIKTIKPPVPTPSITPEQVKDSLDNTKKKESIYDKRKFKTSYYHSEKLPLHLVEIIQEDANEISNTIASEESKATVEFKNTTEQAPDEEHMYQEIDSQITPNDSFLWRRKSSQIYVDNDKSVSDSTYGFVSVMMDETTLNVTDTDSTHKQYAPVGDLKESQNSIDKAETKAETNSDFESNLVEACNKDVLVSYVSRKSEPVIEDGYEPLEPQESDNVLVISIKSDRSSKINCPLPEIPKTDSEQPSNTGENIYHCLLEMRSHPEGDENSLHNYELCGNQLEERTRGDGDSDDGYEYCKYSVKPFCHTSSSGIQIAENYNPHMPKLNDKNYTITKSVSGTSTVSYEKIGSDRIYEKIPPRPPKSKESSPNNGNRHSFVSSDYASYNDNENIYDTIKHADAQSHCYESIPNSPSMVKLRNNLKKQLASAVQKRLSFDNVSNISQSTLSSEQKTNSIYGQRSVLSYNGQEIAFQVPSSETSVSDRSDRSDDWVDVSDEEKTEEKKIIM